MTKKIHGAIAFHPGDYLKDELEARGWKQKNFAELIGKSVSEVSELINGKRNITAYWALIIGTAFEVSPETWLNLQHNYDLYLMRTKKSEKLDLMGISKRLIEFKEKTAS